MVARQVESLLLDWKAFAGKPSYGCKNLAAMAWDAPPFMTNRLVDMVGANFRNLRRPNIDRIQLTEVVIVMQIDKTDVSGNADAHFSKQYPVIAVEASHGIRCVSLEPCLDGSPIIELADVGWNSYFISRQLPLQDSQGSFSFEVIHYLRRMTT